jgi:hypothetical protein
MAFKHEKEFAHENFLEEVQEWMQDFGMTEEEAKDMVFHNPVHELGFAGFNSFDDFVKSD